LDRKRPKLSRTHAIGTLDHGFISHFQGETTPWESAMAAYFQEMENNLSGAGPEARKSNLSISRKKGAEIKNNWELERGQVF